MVKKRFTRRAEIGGGEEELPAWWIGSVLHGLAG